MDLSDLDRLTLHDLQAVAKDLGIPETGRLKKQELILKIKQTQTERSGLMFRDGLLEILPEGFGFLRVQGFLPSTEDVYVSQSQIKRFSLRTGDTVSGAVRPPKDSERYYSLLRIEAINGEDPELAKRRIDYDKLTPVFPDERLVLETTPRNISGRIMDLVSPIGKGQRGLIVAPPKAGKTTLLKSIANSITENNPEVQLIVLLIDERPEEVTDIRRSVQGDVAASTFDELPENHM
ncbi:MAG TPA: transcription termination factor Rho, partial [Armatimonadota bacterium]